MSNERFYCLNADVLKISTGSLLSIIRKFSFVSVIRFFFTSVLLLFACSLQAAFLSIGGNHTCVVTGGGGVQCWGYNIQGQLGNGTTLDSTVPALVTGLDSGVVAIAAGGYHSCAVTIGGEVQCWGNNGAGALGNGTFSDSSVPVAVTGLGSSQVTDVAAGDNYTCALTSGGGVKCWGSNTPGQLGNGSSMFSSVPVDVTGLGSGVTALAAGFQHACAVASGGVVQCWGRNDFGQLGNGVTTDSPVPVVAAGLGSGVTAVTAGRYHTCVLASGGAVQCWGRNDFGQLGNGTITADGSLVPVAVTGLGSGVIAIEAGDWHTCALTGSGGVKCWGENGWGQLGNGSSMPSSVPVDAAGLGSGMIAVAAGHLHTCAMSSGGGVKCWGRNLWGRLGNGTSSDSLIPVAVTNDTVAPSVPGSLTATVANPSRINLAWSASTDAVGVTAYRVYRDGSLIATLGNVTSYSNTGLNPSTSYSYTVAACDAAGNCSVQSTTISATTPVDTVAPSIPSGLTATAVSSSQINLAWTASTDTVGVRWYRVHMGASITHIDGNTTSVNINGLAASTSYSFTVSACDAAVNCSAQSSVVTATTFAPDITAPTVPGGLSATVVSATQINLNWTASTDAVGVTAYKIYRSGSLLTTLGNVTSFSNTGLTASTGYSYKVSACDATGNCSAQSSAVTATTQAPDSDGDGIADSFDNCPLLSNVSQTNTDGDSTGDACDIDDDNDNVVDTSDNCPLNANASQLDWDADGNGDRCDDAVPMPADIAGTLGKDKSGSSVAFAGDFNNDGYGDYIIGIPGFDAPATKPIKDAGRAEVISGKNGAVLASINGAAVKDALGTAVAGGGDVDNDGFADVVIGSPKANKGTGIVVVLFGHADGSAHTPESDIIVGTVAKSTFGSAVALSDVNGDGYADIIIGAPKATSAANLKAAGSVTVYSGDGFSVLGTPFYGAAAKANAGSSVAAGDVNKDGNADIIIGAPNDGGVGSVKAYTQAGGLLLDQSGGTPKSQFGKAVATGDVNGDGYADVLVGAPLDDNTALSLKDTGSLTVFSGDGSGLLVKKYGAAAKANLGNSVAAADVDADGKDDLIAGAWKDDKAALPKALKDTGRVSVWSGSGYVPITTLHGAAAKDYFGCAVSAGDINSDGNDDLIIGIPGFDALPVPPATKLIKDAGKVTVLSGAGL